MHQLEWKSDEYFSANPRNGVIQNLNFFVGTSIESTISSSSSNGLLLVISYPLSVNELLPAVFSAII